MQFSRTRLSDIVHRLVRAVAGESFEEVEESFFGFMLRDGEQKGRPFEPRTVRMKPDLRGVGRVALPVVFRREDDGRWRAKWLHLYLRGISSADRVEENQMSVSKVVRAIVERASDGAIPDPSAARRHHGRGSVGRRAGPRRAVMYISNVPRGCTRTPGSPPLKIYAP